MTSQGQVLPGAQSGCRIGVLGISAVFIAQLYMAVPYIGAMDVTCHCLSSEPSKRNIELFVAPKSVSSVKHISCLYV